MWELKKLYHDWNLLMRNSYLRIEETEKSTRWTSWSNFSKLTFGTTMPMLYRIWLRLANPVQGSDDEKKEDDLRSYVAGLQSRHGKLLLKWRMRCWRDGWDVIWRCSMSWSRWWDLLKSSIDKWILLATFKIDGGKSIRTAGNEYRYKLPGSSTSDVGMNIDLENGCRKRKGGIEAKKDFGDTTTGCLTVKSIRLWDSRLRGQIQQRRTKRQIEWNESISWMILSIRGYFHSRMLIFSFFPNFIPDNHT